MFEVGDKVRAFGLNGVVDEVIKSDTYPIKVRYYTSEYHSDSFTLDGKIIDWHEEPSLVLVEKVKKKVKKYLFAFKDVYGVWSISQRLYSESEVASIAMEYLRLDQTMVEVEE